MDNKSHKNYKKMRLCNHKNAFRIEVSFQLGFKNINISISLRHKFSWFHNLLGGMEKKSSIPKCA